MQIQRSIATSLQLLSLLLVGCAEPDAVSEDEPAQVAEKPSYSFTYNDKNYTIVKETASWLDAVSYATALDGYLVEINSEEEQTVLFEQLISEAGIDFDETNNKFGFAAVWLGGNDLDEEGSWVWNGNNDDEFEQFWEGEIDGNVINGLYNNWGNEPDNNGNQDVLCMGLEPTPINTAGKWTDLDGSANSLFFVIGHD